MSGREFTYADSPGTTYFGEQEQRQLSTSGPLTPLVLTVFEGSDIIGTVDLRGFDREVITFGRGEDRDIVIDSPIVSRKHGHFLLRRGVCSICDDASTNGICVDGAHVSSSILGVGDAACIGDNGQSGAPNIVFVVDVKQAKWHSYPLYGVLQVSIGRSPSCDIVLPHSSVSSLHAVITKTTQGYSIVDSNSYNGTFVNGIPAVGPQPLVSGDIITITNTVFIFDSSELLYNSEVTGFDLVACGLDKVVGKRGKRKKITDNVSLRIGKGEFVAIVGGSGAGKSTLLNCLSGYDPATSGSVYVNGIDLYRNYGIMKNHIGYVPQQDIVYDDLSLKDMLMYATKLRMPPDSTKEDRRARVSEVISMLELDGKESNMIRSLSGGQKKRASIAVELLGDPKLFFLDEPTSGLDPGIERSLMHTLKKMAAGGRTIILVTHNTLNLQLCDKVIFMGRGGRLCCCASPEQLKDFFDVDDFVDIYSRTDSDSERWASQFEQHMAITAGRPAPPRLAPAVPKKKTPSFLTQLVTLSCRYAKLIVNDRQRLLILLAQAPLLALLIAIVAGDTTFQEYENTKSVLFALSCAAFWIGILDAIQEICKERVILKREYSSGLSLGAYVLSKALVLSLLCALQTVLLVVTFLLVVGAPNTDLCNPSFAMGFTAFLTAESAMSLGLLVSALFKNSDRAMALAPILLMPQILFSGLVFKLSGVTEKISYFVNCRWSMEAFGTTADLNGLDLHIYESIDRSMFAHEYEGFYEYSMSHLATDWWVLALFVVVGLVCCWLLLKKTVQD